MAASPAGHVADVVPRTGLLAQLPTHPACAPAPASTVVSAPVPVAGLPTRVTASNATAATPGTSRLAGFDALDRPGSNGNIVAPPLCPRIPTDRTVSMVRRGRRAVNR